MYLQIAAFLIRNWKLGLYLVMALALMILTIKVLNWREEAHKVAELENAIARFNADQQKSRTIGLNLNEGLNSYRSKARELDTETPTGAVFDSDGVRRISQRNAAGRAARQ